MTLPSFLTGAGVAAVVAAMTAFWSQARNFMRYVAGLVLLQKTLDYQTAYTVGVYFKRFYTRLPSGLSYIVSVHGSVDSHTMHTLIPFDMPTQTGIWYGKYGIYLMSVNSVGMSLTSLRLFSNPYKLIAAAINALNEAQGKFADDHGNVQNLSRFCVVPIMGNVGSDPRGYSGNSSRDPRPPTNDGGISGSGGVNQSVGAGTDIVGWWSQPDFSVDQSFMYERHRYNHGVKQNDPFKGLFYADAVHKLIADIKEWYKHADWYAEHGIPWRIGMLLQGPGGTGKSSLARALAETMGLPIYQYYLNTLSDREFVADWDNMQAPCIAALEDFDTVFHGRESTTPHKSLSFECVLNQISGISAKDGVILIVTTNNMHHIDPALGQIDAHGRPTRPGRIDYIVEFKDTEETQRMDIANFILGGWASDLVARLVAEGEGTTAAQFQAMCVNEAMQRLTEQRIKQLGNTGAINATTHSTATEELSH